MNHRTHVAVGVIYNSTEDMVLISKRSNNQHLAGYWEFPGGKVECNEDVSSALKRELFEELGLTVIKAEAFTSICHNYTDKKVLLDVWKVYEWCGTPESKESQEFCWVRVSELNNYKFPDANKHIIQSIMLSPMYVISKESYKNYSQLFAKKNVQIEISLLFFQQEIQVLLQELFQEIIKKLCDQARQYDAKLILNGLATDIDKYPIDGIHLSTNELMSHSSRPICDNYILGPSCHNEEELIKAAEINVNYAFCSPVLPTASHPEANAIGWERFRRLIREVKIPIYALGGMLPTDLEIAKKYGAYGIAMRGAIPDEGIFEKGIKF